jgi:hypothetical protein
MTSRLAVNRASGQVIGIFSSAPGTLFHRLNAEWTNSKPTWSRRPQKNVFLDLPAGDSDTGTILVKCKSLNFHACLPPTIVRKLGSFMAWKRKVSGGLLATIGYVLSPLSWWNDAFVNIPLALLFAWVVSFFYKPAFVASLIIGYWLTNVIGFVLLHKGARRLFPGKSPPNSRREWVADIVVSFVYTAVIIVLLKFGILKPFAGYFKGE